MKGRWIAGLAAVVGIGWSSALALEPIPAIERRIPPPGVVLPVELRAKLEGELKALEERVEKLKINKVDTLDAEVFVKALKFSLVNDEYFRDKDFPLGEKMVALAKERLDGLESGKTPWASQHGLVVRGYLSEVDDSVQPYGLHIPEGVDLKKPTPLLVWLHGRGDKVTDIHFINRCLAKNAALGGYFDSPGVITLAPFGRQCIGWKHSGEIDIFEAIEQVKKQYAIDEDRIVLAGFSMGGAGAWHVGAHYTEKFCAVQPGAGFAETAKYNKLKPEDYPVWYEQKLWGVYDTPDYIRNLLNVPVILYSGENDGQRAAGELMAQALRKEGSEAPHLIGPGMGHRFHPETAAQVQAHLEKAMQQGRSPSADMVTVQTKTLRYPRVHWVEITALQEHWNDSRVDASITGGKVSLQTKNVTALSLGRKLAQGTQVSIDGQVLQVDHDVDRLGLVKMEGKWALGEPAKGLRKKHKLQGPIDDAFLEPFLVVTPDGKSDNELLERWVKFELGHFDKRWRELMRGKLRVKRADEVDEADIAQYHLILWGSPESNSVIKKLADKLPVKWGAKELVLGKKKFDAASHLPVLVYPNPLNEGKYVVINSGHTFREGHDRTNSLQNPKLPDWAILDLGQLPDNLSAGQVVAADFFDERWRVKTGE